MVTFLEVKHFFFVFLGPHLQHIEVSRLGVKSELQLLAYTAATAMHDLNHVCDPHRSSWQCRILDPLSKARNQTCILMNTSGSLPLSHIGNAILQLSFSAGVPYFMSTCS